MAYVETKTSWDYVGLTLIPILDNGELDLLNKIYLPDMGLYRSSNSNRYEDNLIPTLKHTTVEVPGGDGMYWFGSQHTQRQFTVNLAYDNLTAENLDKLKYLLDGKKHLMLIFDEQPYKYYDVVVNTAPQFKYVPFSEDRTNFDRSNIHYLASVRYFKGEATIQFVCYDPYGRGNCLNLESIRNGNLEPCILLPNFEEVLTETRIPINNIIGDGQESLLDLPLNSWVNNIQSITGIAFVNSGDTDLGLRIELTNEIYTRLKRLRLQSYNVESGRYVLNDDTTYLEFNETKSVDNSTVTIDSRLHLVYDAQNNFLNRDIIAGDFFQVPPSIYKSDLFDFNISEHYRVVWPIYVITPLDVNGNIINASGGKMTIHYTYKFF